MEANQPPPDDGGQPNASRGEAGSPRRRPVLRRVIAFRLARRDHGWRAAFGTLVSPAAATAAAAIVVASLVAVGLALAARRGTVGLAGTGHVTRALVRLTVMAALSGVLACEVTELVKRLTGLRESFNRRAVRAYFADDYVVVDPGMSAATQPPDGDRVDLSDAVRRGLEDLRASGRGRTSVPLELTVPPAPPDYAAPIRLLTAQLSPHMEYAARLLATGVISDGRPQPGGPRVRRHLAALLTGDPDPSLVAASGELRDDDSDHRERDTGDDEADAEAFVTQLTIRAERRLDSFQIQATTQWRLLLRRASSAIAAGFVFAAAVASDAGGWTMLAAVVLGFGLGGPFAWLTRDLVRVVERKAVSG